MIFNEGTQIAPASSFQWGPQLLTSRLVSFVIVKNISKKKNLSLTYKNFQNLKI